MKLGYVLVAGGVLIGAGYLLTQTKDLGPSTTAADTILLDGSLVGVSLPASLSENAALGKKIYETQCVICHNVNGSGREGVAPPLVHIIYETSHHGDESFQRAVANGVRGHHWPFGNMPAVEGLTRAEVKMIVTYIRELQRENGIF